MARARKRPADNATRAGDIGFAAGQAVNRLNARKANRNKVRAFRKRVGVNQDGDR